MNINLIKPYRAFKEISYNMNVRNYAEYIMNVWILLFTE